MFPWDQLQAAGDTLAAIIALPWAIADIAIQLVMVLMYPFVVVVSVLQTAINLLIMPFSQLVDAILILGGDFLSIIDILADAMPAPWITLLIAIVLVNIAIRVYFYLKDISILGFKI
jgi:hypothetical protein